MTHPTTKTVTLTVESLTKAGIPEGFHRLNIAKFEGNAGALDRIALYVRQLEKMRREPVGLFFRGPAHSFKSFLACYVLMHSLTQGYSARYVSMPELVELILSNAFRSEDYRKDDFLLIDNLTSETNQFWATALNRVLVYRKDSGRPTLLCSKLDDKQLISTYGNENVELIRDHCVAVRTHVDEEESHRRRDRLSSYLLREES